MKKKKLIIASIVLFIGIILITSSKFLSNNNTLDLKISEIIATSNNSLTFNITNETKKNIDEKKVMIYLTDNNGKLIMSFPFDITNLESGKTKTEEYYQEFLFDKIPSKGYIKEYIEGSNEIVENVELNSIIGNLLKEKAIEVIEKNFNTKKDLNLKLTAKDIEEKYNIDLGDFKNKKYDCSLTNSFVEISITDYKRNYVPYIECNIFIENEKK